MQLCAVHTSKANGHSPIQICRLTWVKRTRGPPAKAEQERGDLCSIYPENGQDQRWAIFKGKISEMQGCD